MNKTNNNDKDLQDVNEAELEERMEKKCEAWGNSIDQKANAFTQKLPRPVNAFLDALCIYYSVPFTRSCQVQDGINSPIAPQLRIPFRAKDKSLR